MRTSTFLDGRRPSQQPGGTADLTAGTANTHVVRHAGRVFALVESSLPDELAPKLDTIGPYDFDGRLHTPITAHPKVRPATGELHFFGYRAARAQAALSSSATGSASFVTLSPHPAT